MTNAARAIPSSARAFANAGRPIARFHWKWNDPNGPSWQPAIPSDFAALRHRVASAVRKWLGTAGEETWPIGAIGRHFLAATFAGIWDKVVPATLAAESGEPRPNVLPTPRRKCNNRPPEPGREWTGLSRFPTSL